MSGGIRRKRSKVLRSPLRDGIGWTQGKACHVMATNEPSVPSAPAPAQVCSHFIHMAQIAGSPNFQLGSQSCIEIWTCWRPSGHHLDTISTYLHYLSFREPGTIPLVLGPSLQRREIWRRSWKLCNLSCPVLPKEEISGTPVVQSSAYLGWTALWSSLDLRKICS